MSVYLVFMEHPPPWKIKDEKYSKKERGLIDLGVGSNRMREFGPCTFWFILTCLVVIILCYSFVIVVWLIM